MNGSCQTPDVVLCACCEGLGPETPQPIANRPGLSAVDYRVGAWATFKASMLAALSDPDNASLAGLRTRNDSDFSIALIDAWALVADILTFYQERIANESWLRTALDQRSVMELSRLVGYRPAPGVSASAYLSFGLDTAPGSPDNVLIPAGSRVQSVPGPGESPQTFETSQDLTAHVAFNAIPAKTTVPWSVGADSTATTLSGTNNNLSVGDGILFVTAAFVATLTSDMPQGTSDFHIITSVRLDAASGTTAITWDTGLASGIDSGSDDVFIYVFRKRAALFGVQAPDPAFLTAVPMTDKGSNGDWDYAYKSGTMQVNLDASYPGVSPGQWAFLNSPGAARLFSILSVTETGKPNYTLTSKTTQLTLGGPGTDSDLSTIVKATGSTTAYLQSELLGAADSPYTGSWPAGKTWALQTNLLNPVEGSQLEIVGVQNLNAAQPVAVSGKRLRLQVSDGSTGGFVPQGASAALPVSDGQTFLIDAFPPESLSDNDVWQAVTLSGVSGALTVASADILLLPADKNDAWVSESALLSGIDVAGATACLSFSQPLSRIYDRATVTVNANTVVATHGETVHEILGSGDATNSALSFTLKQTPLTYVSSPSGLGAQSTLQVWANNLQWHETDNFLSSQPADRVFVTRSDQNGNTIAQFGDGDEGARPPTGQMNLRAMYRKGIGLAGMVRAGQLSQPLDRPQGLKSVSNPDPAAGGADPDNVDDVRVNAPLHVLTLDRVVSLEDYQNFARAFAGIAKALATWTWFGKVRGIFLTVAGSGGSQFDATDPAIVHLTQALQSAGSPFVPVQVLSFEPIPFEVAAKVRIDTADYDPDEVLGRVWLAMTAAFAFEARDLGQSVAESEVIAAIQQTAGVVAVELTAFSRGGQGATSPPATVLRAGAPAIGSNASPQPAEMLLLDPASRANIVVWS